MKTGTQDNSTYTPIRAPRGARLSCKGWPQEAALRMLMNSLDPDVAEHPESLFACSELGCVAPNWPEFWDVANALRALAPDETLILQHGCVSGVIHSGENAPRVLILDSDAAAGWIHIGAQGFLPEANELLAAAKQKYLDGDLRGKLVAADRMRGACASLSLAATMHGAAFLGIDADAERIKRCVKTGYCDVMVNDLDEALRIAKNAVRKGEPASVGLIGNPADIMDEMASRGVVPDLMTSSASGRNDEAAARMQAAMHTLQGFGTTVLDSDALAGASDRSAPLLCVALSGEPSDIQRIDRLLLELFPLDESLAAWTRTLQRRTRHQGLPARACALQSEQRVQFGVAVNQLVASGELKAPIVIARQLHSFLNEHKDAGKVERKPALAEIDVTPLVELTNGAAWASIHRDKAGSATVISQAAVADRTNQAASRLERVLSTA
jgi:urocanate hydratase